MINIYGSGDWLLWFP